MSKLRSLLLILSILVTIAFIAPLGTTWSDSPVPPPDSPISTPTHDILTGFTPTPTAAPTVTPQPPSKDEPSDGASGEPVPTAMPLLPVTGGSPS